MSCHLHVEGPEYWPFNISSTFYSEDFCFSFYFPFCDFNAFLSLLGKKPRTKAPRIQRLVTPRVLQHKRRRVALKRQRTLKNKEEASEYAKLLAKRMKVRFKSDLTRKFERHQSLFMPTTTNPSLQTGGQGEAPGTDRQEAPPFFTEGVHIQVRVQPEVKLMSQIKSCFTEKFSCLLFFCFLIGQGLMAKINVLGFSLHVKPNQNIASSGSLDFIRRLFSISPVCNSSQILPRLLIKF